MPGVSTPRAAEVCLDLVAVPVSRRLVARPCVTSLVKTRPRTLAVAKLGAAVGAAVGAACLAVAKVSA